MKELTVGIIGVGNMGSAHLACIHGGNIRGMRVCAVCDIDKTRCDAVRAAYPDLAVYEDFHALLAQKEIEAVIIAVPHRLHGQIACAAFESGKHVLVEKPLDVRLSEARRVCEAARQSGRVFGIMLNQRTNSLFAKAREIVQSGELGKMIRSNWIITNWFRTESYYRSGGWRATWAGEGGGVLLNQAPHNLDLWQWICGMPLAVRAVCNVGKYHSIEVEDEAIVYAEFEDGASGVFITSTGESPGTNRLEIVGTKGKLVLEDGLLKQYALEGDTRDIIAQSDKSFVNPKYTYTEYKSTRETAHAGILQNFTDAVLHGAALLAPGEEGTHELEISNAAYLSAWTGGARIALPMDTERFDQLLFERAAHSVAHENIAEPMTDGYKKRWQVNW